MAHAGADANAVEDRQSRQTCRRDRLQPVGVNTSPEMSRTTLDRSRNCPSRSKIAGFSNPFARETVWVKSRVIPRFALGHVVQIDMMNEGVADFVNAALTDPFVCGFRMIRLNNGDVERRPIRLGEWTVDSAAPVLALADLAGGAGQNLSSGEIDAFTTSPIFSLLESSAKDGQPIQISKPLECRR